MAGNSNGSAGYIQPMNPANNNPDKSTAPKEKGKGKGFLRNAFSRVAGMTAGAAKLGLFAVLVGPMVLGVTQCTINTDYGVTDYEALKYTLNVTGDAYNAEGHAARQAIRYALAPTKGMFGPVVGPEKPITYGSSPHVLVCTPNELQLDVKHANPLAMSYNAAVQTQIDRRVDALNDPHDRMRTMNPDQDFVIMVHKQPSNFDARSAQHGLSSVISTVAVNHGDWACPPASVKNKNNPQYLPEYKDSSYTASWRFVPGLKPVGK